MSGIQVHVRVRPNVESTWATADTVIYNHMKPDTRYMYNRVHGISATNDTIFHEIEPCVLAAFDGKNVTVMAYGQTGGGKTWTMTGGGGDPGLVQRVARLLIDLRAAHKGTVLSMSYVEIYNEFVRDLASDSREEVTLRDENDGTVISGRKEVQVETMEDFLEIAARAERARMYGATDMNERSSRSHIILSIDIYRPGRSSRSTMSLVDLAGSESASRANTDGQLLREGGFINRSLLTLGNVVDAIVDNRSHIPFRESKLTRMLRSCLGGNGLTFIICCVNPHRDNVEQTVSSLRFAQRAMKIRNDPTVSVIAMPSIVFQHLEWVTQQRAVLGEKIHSAYSLGIANGYDTCRSAVGHVMNQRGHNLEESHAIIERVGRVLMLRERRIATQKMAQRRDELDEVEAQALHNARTAEQQHEYFQKLTTELDELKAKRKRLEPKVAIEREQCALTKAEAAEGLEKSNSQISGLHFNNFHTSESSSRLQVCAQEAASRASLWHRFFSVFTSAPHVDGESVQSLSARVRDEEAIVADLEAADLMLGHGVHHGAADAFEANQLADPMGSYEDGLRDLQEQELHLRERQRRIAQDTFASSGFSSQSTHRCGPSVPPDSPGGATPSADRHAAHIQSQQQQRRYAASYESPYSQKTMSRCTTPKPAALLSQPQAKRTPNNVKLQGAKNLLREARERMTVTASPCPLTDLIENDVVQQQQQQLKSSAAKRVMRDKATKINIGSETPTRHCDPGDPADEIGIAARRKREATERSGVQRTLFRMHLSESTPPPLKATTPRSRSKQPKKARV